MNKFLMVLGLSFVMLSAGPLKVGSSLAKLNSFKFETPQGRQMRVPKKLNLVIMAFEKDTGALVNEYLKTKSSLYLQKNRSVFIADIHEMPTFVTNMFALPKLQKYKHLIYLHYSNKFQTVVPNRKEKVTLLHIKDGKIQNISYISTKKELQEAIEK
ncbi:MAG: hypothetical protein KAR81_03855 [Sulfurimonas sp.]|nr:hypothetical protein [Sulfurimonas sp.]